MQKEEKSSGCVGCFCFVIIIVGLVLLIRNSPPPQPSFVQKGLSEIQIGMTESQVIEKMGMPSRKHYQDEEMGYSSRQHVLIWETKNQALMVVCASGKVIRVRDMSGIKQNMNRNNQ
jgi:hypothetical protein